MAALPGTYTVQLSKYVDGEFAALTEPESFELVPLQRQSLPANRRAKFDFEKRVSQLQHAVQSLDRSLDDAVNRVAAAKQALYGAPQKSEDLISRARDIERSLDEITVALRGDRTVSKRFEPTTPSLRQRIGRAAGGFWTTTGPTGTQQLCYEVAQGQFTELRRRLQRVVDVDLATLERDMDKLDIPWTPGRTIPEGM